MLHSTLIPLRRLHHSASMRAILNYLRWHAFPWPKFLPNNAAVGKIDTPNTLLHLLAARRARSRTGRTTDGSASLARARSAAPKPQTQQSLHDADA